jgi:hypothetical protein
MSDVGNFSSLPRYYQREIQLIIHRSNIDFPGGGKAPERNHFSFLLLDEARDRSENALKNNSE